MSPKTFPEIIEENKRIIRNEFQKGYIEGIKNTRKMLIGVFFTDLYFDGECYKMSIKNHKKWEEWRK